LFGFVPINLVDPSGHFGIGDAAVWGATHAPDSWKPGIRNFAGDGLTFLHWWKAKPENCECNQNPELTTNAALFINEWGANQGTQLALSGATTPAKIIAESVSYQTRSLQGEVFIYREVATKTGVDVTKWGAWGPHGRPYTQVSNLADGYYAKTTGAAMKVKNPRFQLVEGMRGFEGAIVSAGYIDAGFQLAGDLISNLCLSPEQLAWRAMIAFGFGVAAGAVGSVVGGIVTLAGVTTSSIVALTSFAASFGATIVMRPTKNKVLEMITNATD